VNDVIVVLVALTALLGLATAVIGLLNQRRTVRTVAKVERISVQINGRLSALLERQDQLLGVLHDNDIPVPPKHALKPDPGPGGKPGE
jgi:Na+-transporting NADH:ubiquinone oxidoreductase subunit NqrF